MMVLILSFKARNICKNGSLIHWKIR